MCSGQNGRSIKELKKEVSDTNVASINEKVIGVLIIVLALLCILFVSCGG